MRIGPLRHRVHLQERTTEQDAAGEPLRVWVTRRTVWSSVRPKLGRETASVGAKVLTTFSMRYQPGLSPAWRLVWQGRVFDIASVVDVDGVHHEHQVMASELVGVSP